MNDMTLIFITLFYFAGIVLTLFGLVFMYEYTQQLPTREKWKYYSIFLGAGVCIMLVLSTTVFKGSPIGEGMQASLIGFGFFGFVAFLLWIGSPKQTE